MAKLKVVAVEAGKKGYRTEMDFKEMQKFVDGYVQMVHLYDDIFAVVNEDGIAKGLEPNRHMILQDKGHYPLHIVGNFVVVKSVGEEMTDMSEEELKEAEFIFRNESKNATIFI